MRILVTGSRDLTDCDLVYDALSALWETSPDRVTVVHGGARGADTFASQWCKIMRNHGVREETHHADWKQFGKSAGHRRNAEMVDSGVDEVVAFYKKGAGNVGTSDCVRKAESAGLHVTKIVEN